MEQMFPRTLAGGQADAEIVLESLMEIATVKEEGSGCSGTLAIFDRNPTANASSSPNKKRMRQFGKVDIPQAFIAALRMDSD